MDIPIDKKTTYTPEQRKEFAEMKERQKELRENEGSRLRSCIH